MFSALSSRRVKGRATSARPGHRYADRIQSRESGRKGEAGTVAVVNTGLCNLDSMQRALSNLGVGAVLANTPADLSGCDRIILPGVGSFGAGMSALNESGFSPALQAAAAAQTPILGVCLGMQLLAQRGHEGGTIDGLGLIGGEVRRLDPGGSKEKLPHVGWNEVVHDGRSDLLRGVPSGADFYFVHSYHFVPSFAVVAVAHTPYCGGFVSVIQEDQLFGAQFHPEKSQKAGSAILRNFINISVGQTAC
jgi:imidazole glycerol-phosphate synthase subunit HisH